jgi:hypothetical protein
MMNDLQNEEKCAGIGTASETKREKIDTGAAATQQ